MPNTESQSGYKSPDPIPIFQKIGPFKISRGYKIGEIKSYHHNYEFSMEIKHQSNSQYERILQGKLTKTFLKNFPGENHFFNNKSRILRKIKFNGLFLAIHKKGVFRVLEWRIDFSGICATISNFPK